MGKAEELKDAGNKHFKNEEYQKAIKCYKEGLLLDPGNPTINCNLAQAYLAVKEFAEAEVHAVVTLAHQADSVKGFYRATKAALGMSKKDRALSYLRTGLVNCPKADELKTLYEEINKENGDGDPSNSASISTKPHSENKETKEHTKTSSDAQEQGSKVEAKRPSRSDQNKVRSRSSGSHNRNNSKDPSKKVSVRSISVNRSSNEKSLHKKNSEPKGDVFIDTLVKIQNELSPEEKSPQLKEREALMDKQQKLQVYMKEGSEAMKLGSAKQASEKYKCALDIMGECDIKVFGLPEVNRIVLRYILSICWIETLNYNNIIQSVGCLTEIETNHAKDLPAVYYGLGRAFYRLNRFKIALDHLDKGLKMVETVKEIIPHPWPGTMLTIVETTRMGLKESLNKLCYECRTYREPDAICRYKECLNVSSHICPSEIIFFSDPDFVGYVVIICQENCKITYHVGCWKHYKESLSSVGKLSDKDVLGQACLTSDCINERNEVSVIVRIEVYGEDGKIKTSCLKEPTKTDNVNEHRKERKKKNEKAEKPVKVKVARTRVKKLPPSTQNIVKKAKRRTTISIEDLSHCKQKLTMLREINFGVEEAISWNPQKDYFGRPDISTLKTFGNNKDSEVLRGRKNNIYKHFYEYLNDEGAQKVSAIEQKWLEDISLFHGINEFMSEHDGICDFLLLSVRFACIDDYLCLADQLSDTYQKVQEEVGESLTFILSNSNHTIEHEPEVDLVVNKCARKLIEDGSNGSIPDSHVDRPETITPSSSQGYSSEMPWNKRDSECDSYINQDLSGSSRQGEDDSDYDVMIASDYEDDDDFGKIITTIDSKEPQLDTNVELVKESTPVSSQIAEKPVDISFSPSAHCSSSAGSVYYELSDKDVKDFQIADAATQVIDQQLVLKKDVDSQTDNSCDLEKENEDLRTVNCQLLHAATMLNDEKQNLMSRFQEEVNGYKQKIQLYESRLSSLVVEKEQNENDLQFQIGIRDSKFDAVVKKHREEITKLTKKNEEDAGLLKRNVETMTELNKEVEKQANTIIRLEDQLRRANEQVLTLRKLFGEFKLDSYLAKCKERLQSMTVMIQWFQDDSPSADEMKRSIEAWEQVAVSLQETRDLLQVQYDILSQQLKNKVSSDFLLQLELADLPTEPHYPLQDMNNVLRFAMEHVHQKNGFMNGKNIMNDSRSNFQYTDVSSYPNSMLGVQNLSNQDLLNMRTTNPFGYRPPFYPNSFGGPNTFSSFPRTMSPTHSNHHGHTQNSSENAKSTVTGSWPPELHVGGLRSDKPDQVVTGGKQGPSFRAAEPITLPTFANHVSESRETLAGGECTNRVTGISERKDGPSFVAEAKQRDMLGEKRTNSSSASGLTPIEITKPGMCGLSMKTMGFETKQAVKSSTQIPKRWNYQKLFEELQKFFRSTPEVELSESLFIVREKNGNKLSGLSVSTIIRRVEKVLEDRSSKKIGNMGMDKFGGTAWGEVKENNVSWENDDDDENDCTICHINIEANSKTSLQCKHTFHTECIRLWLHTNSTCPICRKYTRLIDEFPPLA